MHVEKLVNNPLYVRDAMPNNLAARVGGISLQQLRHSEHVSADKEFNLGVQLFGLKPHDHTLN